MVAQKVKIEQRGSKMATRDFNSTYEPIGKKVISQDGQPDIEHASVIGIYF